MKIFSCCRRQPPTIESPQTGSLEGRNVSTRVNKRSGCFSRLWEAIQRGFSSLFSCCSTRRAPPLSTRSPPIRVAVLASGGEDNPPAPVPVPAPIPEQKIPEPPSTVQPVEPITPPIVSQENPSIPSNPTESFLKELHEERMKRQGQQPSPPPPQVAPHPTHPPTQPLDALSAFKEKRAAIEGPVLSTNALVSPKVILKGYISAYFTTLITHTKEALREVDSVEMRDTLLTSFDAEIQRGKQLTESFIAQHMPGNTVEFSDSSFEEWETWKNQWMQQANILLNAEVLLQSVVTDQLDIATLIATLDTIEHDLPEALEEEEMTKKSHCPYADFVGLCKKLVIAYNTLSQVANIASETLWVRTAEEWDNKAKVVGALKKIASKLKIETVFLYLDTTDQEATDPGLAARLQQEEIDIAKAEDADLARRLAQIG